MQDIAELGGPASESNTGKLEWSMETARFAYGFFFVFFFSITVINNNVALPAPCFCRSDTMSKYSTKPISTQYGNAIVCRNTAGCAALRTSCGSVAVNSTPPPIYFLFHKSCHEHSCSPFSYSFYYMFVVWLIIAGINGTCLLSSYIMIYCNKLPIWTTDIEVGKKKHLRYYTGIYLLLCILALYSRKYNICVRWGLVFYVYNFVVLYPSSPFKFKLCRKEC